jgi:hypothetical protein
MMKMRKLFAIAKRPEGLPPPSRTPTLERRNSPKITICEIFSIVRFSTFSTASTQSGQATA